MQLSAAAESGNTRRSVLRDWSCGVVVDAHAKVAALRRIRGLSDSYVELIPTIGNFNAWRKRPASKFIPFVVDFVCTAFRMRRYRTLMPLEGADGKSFPMLRDEGDAQRLPFTPVRLTQLSRPVQLRLRQNRGVLPPSLFTLHTVQGFRLPGGQVQVEHIAGLCHLRNCLKTYGIEQIDAFLDPVGMEIIDDLLFWLSSSAEQARLDLPLSAQDAFERRRAAQAALAQQRKLNSVAMAIEKAITCAASRGLVDVADRLTALLDSVRGDAGSVVCDGPALPVQDSRTKIRGNVRL